MRFGAKDYNKIQVIRYLEIPGARCNMKIPPKPKNMSTLKYVMEVYRRKHGSLVRRQLIIM
jgi:hypothetical protein